MSAVPDEGFRQYRFTPPDGATTVLLVRHGESAPAHPDRPFPMVDGHGDPPLDPVGHEQAERLADRLQHERIDAIYVTTLQRTYQTAAPLASRYRAPQRRCFPSRPAARRQAWNRPGLRARWRVDAGAGRVELLLAQHPNDHRIPVRAEIAVELVRLPHLEGQRAQPEDDRHQRQEESP